MEWLMIILAILAVPFFIGYAVGKGSSRNSSNNDEARIEGQREVRDYLISFLSSQPQQISKGALLKELGASKASKSVAQEVKPKPLIEQVDATGKAWREHSPDIYATQRASASKVLSVSYTKNKQQKDLQNINTILYVASFLLVAAAVLFIGTAIDDSLKFIGTWIITIGFYVSGMILHATSKRLRPAAIAFIGTGLALLPFAGLATDILLIHDPTISWFITSILGLVLYLFATLRLQSQLLAYITLGFVFSMTTSSVAVLQIGFVWYFILIILVASLLNITAFLKPRLLPGVFLRPIEDSGQLAVPLAVFGSWWNNSQVPLWQNAVVLAVASLHYAVAALAPTKAEYRQLYVFLSRLAASIAAVLFVYDISQKDLAKTGMTLTVVAIIQIVASALLAKKNGINNETFWLWGGMVAQLAAIAFWAQSDNRAEMTTFSLSITAFTSFVLAAWLRQARFAIVGVLTVAALPMQIGKDLLRPNLLNEFITQIYIAISVFVMLLRKFWARLGDKKDVVILAYGLYLTIAGLLSFTLPQESSAVYFLAISLLLAVMSYVEKQISVQVIANAVFLVAIYMFVGTFEKDTPKHLLETSWIAAGVFYPIRVLLSFLKDHARAQVMGVYSIAILMLVGLVFIVTNTYAVDASLTLIVASLLISAEGWFYKQYEYYEVAIITTTLALQRIAAVNYNNVEMLLYANWWGAVLYGLAWLRRSRKEKQATQSWATLSLLILFASSIIYISPESTAFHASLTLIFASVILVIEGWSTKQHGYYEVAALTATFALQRVVSLGGDYDWLVYTHWWALILALLAGARYHILDKDNALHWLVASLCVLSVPTGFSALGDPSKYQLLFLIEHVVLLAVGGIFNYRLVILWGASGVGLAVLYWLKDQTYILLGLLGLGLIGLAIWRLLSSKDKQ